MFWHILGWLFVGLLIGAVARVLVRGTGGLGLLATAVVGIAGSFVGGFLGYLLFDHDKANGAIQPSGWLGSIIGAVIVLWILRRVNRGSVRRRVRR